VTKGRLNCLARAGPLCPSGPVGLVPLPEVMGSPNGLMRPVRRARPWRPSDRAC
jgi:hypothetical protein